MESKRYLLSYLGLEVGSIRRIQVLDTAYWGFLGVKTTLDIFQNIHILYLEYGVLSISGYGVLSFIHLWSLFISFLDIKPPSIFQLAQALAALKSVKPKVKANVVEEPSVPVSADSTKDKGKGIMVEEPVKKLSKKKDLIRLDEEIASKLQAEFDEEERLAREKDEANVALTEEWEDIQAKVDVDYQLAQRLQAEEQE
ncbi:hypothetical protein Tco_0453710 [Tanacetum coccineum]